jgi:hypothetical protein
MKILHTIWGMVFLLLLFTACTKEVGTYNVELPKGNIMLKNLMPQRVSDQMILEVVEIVDNRCPVGEVCNSNGEVIIGVKALVEGNFFKQSICYNSVNSTDTCVAILEGHAIQVIRVSPYPDIYKPVKSMSDYLIEVKVEKIKD